MKRTKIISAETRYAKVKVRIDVSTSDLTRHEAARLVHELTSNIMLHGLKACYFEPYISLVKVK